MSSPAWSRPGHLPKRHFGRRNIAVALSLALAVSLMPQYAPQAQAEAKGISKPGIAADRAPVSGRTAAVKRHAPNPVDKAVVKQSPTVVWPTAGSDDIHPGVEPMKAHGLPVRIAATRAKPGKLSPDGVRVEILSRKKAALAGVDGVLLKVNRTDDAAQPGTVHLDLDYSGFADAYGGGYGSRLRLVQYPACLLTTPAKAECATPKVLASRNDSAKQTVSADITAAPAATAATDPTVQTPTADSSSAMTLLAAEATASGDQGSYGATSLQPSSQWSVSNSSGAFNWSYPLRTPPVPGGLAPPVSLGYSSQSVDGQTAATNNQGSWVGQGFSYEPGYIERRYKPCAEDGHDKTNGDQCWGTDNATISLAGGTSGELIKDDTTGEWRVSGDDNVKVEHLTGSANQDNNGEYWKVTNTDGTEYYFGLHHLPGWTSGHEVTNSTWTVPVYGDDSGEPCYNSTFADAYCTQAWRWNLDYVKDPHSNAMSFFYATETNYYTQGLKTDENGKPYVRGGYLERIDYGQRDSSVYTTPAAARVVFDTDERCLDDAADCEPGDLTDATASRWPDVPWDRNCKVDTKCAGQNSPTFWTRKKISKIHAQIRSGATSYKDVDSWTLQHVFVDNGDGSESLWLQHITHTGHVGGTASMPSVELNGQQLPNRVDIVGDNIQPMNRFRLSGVANDTGGDLNVIYETECTPDSLPAVDASTKLCYPVKWSPPGATDPITDWFHKYVVRKVTDSDLTGGSPDTVTSYDYIGDAGWKTPPADGLSKDELRTRSDWRGYGTVRVAVSDGSNKPSNTLTQHVFLRGLEGDPVVDSEGVSHPDADELSGFELETTTYNGSTVVEKSISTPWTHTTATAVHNWGTVKAHYVRNATTSTYTTLEGGSQQETRSTTTYDTATGRPEQVDDFGEVGVGTDNQCTRTYYADNTAQHMLSYISRVETVAVDCGTTPDRATQVISDDLTSYDGQANGAAPTKGDTTKVQRLASHNGTTPTYETVTESTVADFDALGRPTKVKDAAGTATTIAYTETYGLTTKKVETNPLTWTTTTEYTPEWGQPLAQVDPNAKRTDLAYDALGRLTSVWLADRSKAGGVSPSIKYSYLVRTDAPVAVETQKVQNDGSYGAEYTIYDGNLRPRQIQTEGPGDSRMVADTFYDGPGRIVRTNSTYNAAGAPSDLLFLPQDVDAQALTEYDGAGRRIADIFAVNGTEKWRTTTSYGGDRVHVDPPDGQAPTTTISDARGHVTALRQYKGDAPLPSGTAADYQETTYSYFPAGQLKSVRDAAGNDWTYTYDQRGRKITSTDPDTGRTTYAYDVLDRLTSTTDARGKKVSTSYDAIGRVLSTWDGEPTTGTKLTLNTYDTAAKGETYGTYRYLNGTVHDSVINATLDDLYRPTLTKYSLSKTAEPELGGTYQFTTEYNRDGTVNGTGVPAAAGLAGESVTYDYDALQRPTGMKVSGTQYVSDVDYSPTSQLRMLGLSSGAPDAKKTWLTYEYERGTDRLTHSQVNVLGASSVTYDAKYAYDTVGNVTSVADTPTGGETDVQCFRYDWLRRMTEAWTTSNTPSGAGGTGPGDSACTPAPTASTIGGAAPYWHSYEFDSNTGNRTKATIHAVIGRPESVRTYSYYDADQDGTAGETGDGGPHTLTKVVQDTAAYGGNPAVTSQDTFTYDSTGNTSKRILNGSTQTLGWNPEGRLASSTDAAGRQTTFVYDAGGSRIIRKAPGETTYYLPGMELKLDTTTKAVTGTRYYSFAGQTVAVRSAGGLHFLASDPHGTAEIAVDPATGEVTRRRMDPFGQERGTASGTWVDDKGFLGKPVDESTGLTHLGAREYEPENGRFISADPVIDYTDPQQINGYTYSNSNPITFSDPSGTFCDGCSFNNPDSVWTADNGPGCTTYACYNHDGKVSYKIYYPPAPAAKSTHTSTAAQQKAAKAQAKANAAKQRAIAVAKELAQIAMDELGITDALDCFTTGSLGACGATAVNIATSFVGGLVAKMAKKYGVPWNWAKGYNLGKRVLGLLDKLVSGLKTWWKESKAASWLEGLTAKSCNSFTPDTEVLMADGSTRPIKDVKIGDKVVATDPETGKTRVETVTAEIRGTGDKHLVQITVDTDGTSGHQTSSITATDGHPFWVPELHAWITATNLHAGNWLRTSAGTYVQITAVKRWTQNATANNLTVADLHTYYVVAGTTPILVHNCGERIYEANPKHGSEARATSRGGSSAEPSDGQGALDNSVQIKATSPRRVGVDPGTGEAVILDRHREAPCGCTVEGGTNEFYHGHVRTDINSDPGMQLARNALRRAVKSGEVKRP